MKTYDVKPYLNWAKKEVNVNPKGINTFAGDPGINEVLRDLKLQYKVVTEEYKFSDGKGKIVKSLKMELDLTDLKFPLQPHVDFGGEFCDKMIDILAQLIDGQFEAHLDEQISAEMKEET